MMETDANLEGQLNNEIEYIGGVSSYTDLSDKPSINDVVLENNKTLDELGIQPKGDYALKNEIPDTSSFITNTVDNLINYYKKTETYSQDEINNLIGNIQNVKIQIVDVLPEIGESNIIYFVPKETTKESDIYDEYIYINDWEHIGSTDIDLSGYVKTDDLNIKLQEYVLSTDLTEILNDYALKTEIPDVSGYIEEEIDPTVPSWVKGITEENINNWNNLNGIKIIDVASENPINLHEKEVGIYFIKNSSGQGGSIYYGKNYGSSVAPKAKFFAIIFTDSVSTFTENKWLFIIDDIALGKFKLFSLSSNNEMKYDYSLVIPYFNDGTYGGNKVLVTTNSNSYTPTTDYNPSTKLYTDKTHYENMVGYDASKTQILKNINGTLTWVDEE